MTPFQIRPHSRNWELEFQYMDVGTQFTAPQGLKESSDPSCCLIPCAWPLVWMCKEQLERLNRSTIEEGVISEVSTQHAAEASHPFVHRSRPHVMHWPGNDLHLEVRSAGLSRGHGCMGAGRTLRTQVDAAAGFLSSSEKSPAAEVVGSDVSIRPLPHLGTSGPITRG